MRYLFNGKVEKTHDIFQVKIPFNVWEVCKKRDVIGANIVFGDVLIACELLPIKNGKYVIQLREEDVSHFGLEKEHEILLEIPGSLIKISQSSPYSLDAPIRKIDGIELINQTVDGLCSQTCVAMLAGVAIAEVMRVTGLQEWQAKMGEIISALDYYGIGHSDIVIYTEGRGAALPKCCIMMEKMGLYCHYLVHYDGKFYDPNMPVFAEYDVGKLLGYLEVFC